MDVNVLCSALFAIQLIVLAAIFHMVPAVVPIAWFKFVAAERTLIENPAEIESLLEAEGFASAFALELHAIERLLLKPLLSARLEFVLAHGASGVTCEAFTDAAGAKHFLATQANRHIFDYVKADRTLKFVCQVVTGACEFVHGEFLVETVLPGNEELLLETLGVLHSVFALFVRNSLEEVSLFSFH